MVHGSRSSTLLSKSKTCEPKPEQIGEELLCWSDLLVCFFPLGFHLSGYTQAALYIGQMNWGCMQYNRNTYSPYRGLCHYQESLSFYTDTGLIVSPSLLMRGCELSAYMYVWNQYRLVELPWDSAWTWWFTLVGVDFCYYWVHRTAHGNSTTETFTHTKKSLKCEWKSYQASAERLLYRCLTAPG